MWNGTLYDTLDLMGIPRWQYELSSFLNDNWFLIPFIGIGFGLLFMIVWTGIENKISKKPCD